LYLTQLRTAIAEITTFYQQSKFNINITDDFGVWVNSLHLVEFIRQKQQNSNYASCPLPPLAFLQR
jgi:hypothetical protein